MTRHECEMKILDRLAEIRDIISEYDSVWDGNCLLVDRDWIEIFRLKQDERGEYIPGEYALRAHREVGANNERMAV